MPDLKKTTVERIEKWSESRANANIDAKVNDLLDKYEALLAERKLDVAQLKDALELKNGVLKPSTLIILGRYAQLPAGKETTDELIGEMDAQIRSIEQKL